MDAAIESYDRAWNVSSADERRRLLEAALTEDRELIERRGRVVERADDGRLPKVVTFFRALESRR